MTLTEKVAYLKGLVEGIGVDETTNNGKIMKAVLDVLDDMAFTVSDLEDSTSELYEEVEAIDEDLSSLEDEIYGKRTTMMIAAAMTTAAATMRTSTK